MNSEIIKIFDDGVLLEIPFSACVLFHGRDSIGGLSLGYRLLGWALNELEPNRPIERKEFSFRTAFPGPGVRDAIEMVTRAVTRGSYSVLDHAPVGAPEGVYGRMYFEFFVNDKRLAVGLKPGVMSNEFIQTGRKIKKGSPSFQDLMEWKRQKEALSAAVWSVANIRDVLDIY